MNIWGGQRQSDQVQKEYQNIYKPFMNRWPSTLSRFPLDPSFALELR